MAITRFLPGQIVAAPGALQALEEAGENPAELLNCHVIGDWGELSGADQLEKRALVCGRLPAPFGGYPFNRHQALDHHRS
jgi:hypothetical protein